MTASDTYSTPTSTPVKWQLWLGRGISAFVGFGLLMSASMKLMHKPEMETMFTNHLGWPLPVLTTLAVLEITSVVLYLIPQTAFLGAVLVTGYLGGAIATHLRVGDAPTAPLVLAVLAWVGLFLRDARVRKLLPLRAL